MNKEIALKLELVEHSKNRLKRLRQMLIDETNYYREQVDELEKIKPKKTIRFRYMPTVIDDGGVGQPQEDVPIETVTVDVYVDEADTEALGRFFHANPEHFRVMP